VLEAGPAACSWSDQCWTLARIAEIVRRGFAAEYTLAGLDLLLHRIGWSVQVPSRKATERDASKSRLRVAATLSSICCGLLAPTSAEVTRPPITDRAVISVAGPASATPGDPPSPHPWGR
jgi:hypothetical protein